MTAPVAFEPVRRWRHDGAREWRALEERTRVRIKVAVLLVAVVAAYHYSLSSLLQTLTTDTPLAYLGLVPILALGIAWVNRRPRRSELPIHDRQLDVSIGVPLVAVAVVASFVLPARFGAIAWVNRIDLLFLPFFVAGATVLLFGVRIAWRQRAALLFLFLAWPWPYTRLLLGTLGGLRGVTVAAITRLVGVVPVAKAMPGAGDTGLFAISHGGQSFSVSIVTACSGVDSVVGFLLVGIALAVVASGRPLRKLAWLATAVTLLWVLNLVRLLAVFGAGAAWGRSVALEGLHPYMGLVLFTVGVVAILALMRPFGLQLGRGAVGAAPVRTTGPARHHTILLTTVVLLVGAAVVATGTARLREFDPVASAAGEPRLSSYLARPAAIAGWSPTFLTEYQQGRQLFGGSSRWFRYLYVPTGRSALRSTLPVTADVVDAGNLDGFDSYGVTSCYSFHGYALRDVRSVDLGAGVRGQTLSFSGGRSRDWSIVYWLWPVRTGDGTRYERVILYLQNTGGDKVSAPGLRPSAGSGTVARRLETNRAFLVGFAREIVRQQRTHRDFETRIAAVQTPNAARDRWLAAAHTGGTGASSGDGATTNGPGSPRDAHDRFWIRYFERHPEARPDAAANPVKGNPA